MRTINLIFSVFFIISSSFSLQAQDVLLTIGNKQITADEFKYIYAKNNTENIGKKTPEEYLQLFVNFKLFVAEAEALKMDTSQQFQNELQGYKDQLAQPFLSHSKVYDKFLKEAYENAQTDVKFDVIFVKVDRRATDEQKKRALEKANKIRNRIIKGENFYEVAKQTSDQSNVAQNHGKYPFVHLSRLPYGLQSYFKTANIGQSSEPILTPLGYYIVRMQAKRPNPGQVQVAHIMIATPGDIDSVQMKQKIQKADSIYQQLQLGVSFEELAEKYSDDKNSASQGGVMRPFTTGRMVEPFEEAAFGLEKIGDISKPIQTGFGLHIIKLIDKKPARSFQEMESILKNEIDRDPERQNLIMDQTLETLKNKFEYRPAKSNHALLDQLDSNIFKAQWKYSEGTDLSTPIFITNEKIFPLQDFADFLVVNQRQQQPLAFEQYYNDRYKRFVYNALTELEREQLETSNTDYANIVREYHDGMLLFEYKKKYIWDKASEDSVTLERFYKKNKELFKTDMEIEATIYEYTHDRVVNRFMSLSSSELKKLSTDEIIESMGRLSEEIKLLKSGIYTPGNDPGVDKIFEVLGENPELDDHSALHIPEENFLVHIIEKKSAKPKPFEQIKGLVVAKYQTQLEAQQLNELKKKYPVKTNTSVLEKIKREL